MTGPSSPKPVGAVDRLGEPVPTPAGVDPKRWRKFCAQVVMLPGNGCHLWASAPRRGDGYGQFWAKPGDLAGVAGDGVPMLPGMADVDQDQERTRPRTWRAHRFAYVAITGHLLRQDDFLMHLCDQPLCVPVTAEALEHHLAPADNRTNSLDRDQKGRTITPTQFGRTAWSRGPANGPLRRSLAIHAALTDALAAGVGRADLAGIVAAADRDVAGDDHPTLF